MQTLKSPVVWLVALMVMYIPPQILKSYQFGFVNSVNTSNINLVYNTFIPERLFAINFIKVVVFILWSPPNFIFPFLL